ncbi:hypothetical protein PGT21_017455 [Puccinia graminis f. sp. tritici]|uniref:Uncharacterized protein n=1 Tax=Puccinia graminis f. sp. tritici TaxID=56615 RepID=A0A5B0Q619_PUCGR|nr:hypothetical protein PGT21_017455 [Puccinia graminis f. sp. tritici]
MSSPAKKKPPWPDTAGRTLVPSLVFVLVDSSLVHRSSPGPLIGHRRWRFQDKRQASRPFFPPSSSSDLPASSPTLMARSVFDRPPTPYPAQPHPQPFTRIEMAGAAPMNLDAAVGPPTAAPPASSNLPLAARIAPAGAIAPPFGRGPPPAYFGPNPTRPRPAHGYRRYNINGGWGGFRGGFAPGSNFRPRVSVPPFYPNFNQGRRTIVHPPSPGISVNRTAIDIPFLPPAAPQTRNLNSPIAESVHSSQAASPQASESHAGTVEDFLIPQSRVPSPNPPGFYDPEDYHRLTRDQVESLLDWRAQPERFNRYDFAPQHFTDLYESITTAMVHHFNTYPAANAAERDSRVRLFRFATRRYRTMTRRV